jgi:hypothetical protein
MNNYETLCIFIVHVDLEVLTATQLNVSFKKV